MLLLTVPRRTLALLACSLLLALAYAPSAAAEGVSQVSGLMTPDAAGVCTDNPAPEGGAFVVTGALEGCWYVDTLLIEHTSTSGGFRAVGTETFVGCTGDGDCGRFSTTYTFTAKFVGDMEAHGRCHHPIVGGDGGFAGVTGVVNMHDLPDGSATYKGHLSH